MRKDAVGGSLMVGQHSARKHFPIIHVDGTLCTTYFNSIEDWVCHFMALVFYNDSSIAQ